MGLPVKLEKFLKKHKVDYTVQGHPETFTSVETAQAEHIPGKKIAKVVMIKADDRDVMVVVPSTRTVDLFKLSAVLDTYNIRIEEEKDFQTLFPDCELGAMPAFGKLYGIPCYVDNSLREEDEICFNAGNHLETIKIATEDFLRVAKAVLGDFSVSGKKVAA